MKKNSVDPFVFTRKTAYMQRVADLVRNNHVRYVTGQIPMKKAVFFAQKMDLYYHCHADKVTAFRQRKLGFCSSRLLFLYTEGNDNLTWILLVTPGEWPTPHDGKEKWLDPMQPESRVGLTGYELVRHIRKGNADPSWTWRYNSTRYDELRNAIVTAIRSRNAHELEKLIAIIWRSPSFAGVREQVKKFSQLIKGEWTRTGVGNMPEIPSRIGYIRRVPDKGKTLTKLIKELQNEPQKERRTADVPVQSSTETA